MFKRTAFWDWFVGNDQNSRSSSPTGGASISPDMTLEETLVDGACVLKVSGEADLQGVPELQEAARSKLGPEANVPVLVIDFEAATFVNTPVWGVVVECFQRTGKSGQKFAVSGLSGRVKDSFDIVRLGEFVPHFSNIQEAVDGLAD